VLTTLKQRISTGATLLAVTSVDDLKKMGVDNTYHEKLLGSIKQARLAFENTGLLFIIYYYF
jgi:hypothetical protein